MMAATNVQLTTVLEESNSNKVQITVAYAPVIIKVSPQQISCVSGNDGKIQVYCLMVLSLSQRRFGQLTDSSQWKTFLVNESGFIFSGLHSLNLTLTNVTPADTAKYSIKAINYVGNVSMWFRVDVIVPPRLVPLNKTDLFIPTGSEVTIIDLANFDAVTPVAMAHIWWIPSGGIETFDGSNATVTFRDVFPGNPFEVTILVFHPAQNVSYTFQLNCSRSTCCPCQFFSQQV